MRIKINDFLSIRKAEFSIDTGITVFAGKNGCGKSQLLLGIAQTNSESDILEELGFLSRYRDENSQIEIYPEPDLILYRPAIRVTQESNEEFSYTRPLNSIINSESKVGYVRHTKARSENLYGILSNFYIAGTNKNADPETSKRWEILVSLFNEVFGKQLCAEVNIFNGTKIGVRLKNNMISPMTTLSTGELEFLSLLSDLLLEYRFRTDEINSDLSSLNMRKIAGDTRSLPKSNMILIDELDAHFHPDLQRKIIDIITPLCKDKYVIITTHSPSVMLSVPSDNLFYMYSAKESKDNQIVKVSDDIILYNALAEMYQGFIADIKLASHLNDANNNIILRYTQQCLETPNVISGSISRDYDPQVSSIRNVIFSQQPNTIVEVGAGKGRLLTAFAGFDKSFLAPITYCAIEPNENLHNELLDMAKKANLIDRTNQFKVESGYQSCPPYDFCIMANLIHEIPPTELADFFNSYIRLANPGATIAILEVAELGVGEENFTMFGPDAIKAIFSCHKEFCQFRSVQHHTARGMILYDMNLKVISNNFSVTQEDIVTGLKKIVEVESNFLSQKNDSTLSYAFHIHNLAYATLNLQKMQQ